MNDDDYSATELGSHWFERPTPEATPSGPPKARSCGSAPE